MVENFNDTLQVSYGILFNFLKKNRSAILFESFFIAE